MRLQRGKIAFGIVRAKKQLIAPALYKKILAIMPVSCVDAVVVCQSKFLLVKRKNEPAQGKWWLIGGRILKGESLREAAIRKVKEETGLKIRVLRFLITKETIFRASALGPPTHTVNSVFLVKARKVRNLSPDSQGIELRWFSKLDRRWPSYVKEMLVLSGFRK